jgi:hypothetical protein
MRFEIISNDLKCILFEKYGFLFLKSPIHVYQYEMPVPVVVEIITCEAGSYHIFDAPEFRDKPGAKT